MKPTKFYVYFFNGDRRIVYEFGFLNAGIVACFEQIRDARPHEIDYIEDAEHGELKRLHFRLENAHKETETP